MSILPFGYEKEYHIRFYDCDYNGNIKVSAVLRYLADLAELHYDAKGYGHDLLWEKKMVFLLAEEALRFHRRPRGDERLIFTTWERQIKGPRYFRDFEIYDKEGALVISASTTWLLVNPITRQILRPAACDFHRTCIRRGFRMFFRREGLEKTQNKCSYQSERCDLLIWTITAMFIMRFMPIWRLTRFYRRKLRERFVIFGFISVQRPFWETA